MIAPVVCAILAHFIDEDCGIAAIWRSVSSAENRWRSRVDSLVLFRWRRYGQY